MDDGQSGHDSDDVTLLEFSIVSDQRAGRIEIETYLCRVIGEIRANGHGGEQHLGGTVRGRCTSADLTDKVQPTWKKNVSGHESIFREIVCSPGWERSQWSVRQG